jgi:hypothetical protein
MPSRVWIAAVKLGAQGRGAGEQAFHAAQIVAIDGRMLRQRHGDRRNDMRERNRPVLQHFQERFQFEPRQRHDRRAAQEAEVHDHRHASAAVVTSSFALASRN